MIRCLVFDFDGTLVPSNKIKHAAYAETVAATPGAASRILEIVAGNPDYDRYKVFAQLAAEFPAAGDTATLTARYGTICESQILPLLANGPTRDLITALTDLGLSSHIATATPYADIARIFDRAGITTAFVSIHGGPETKTAALASIIADGGYNPAEVAMIGDGSNDHAAAAAHGCPFVQITGDTPELYAEAASAGVNFLASRLGLQTARRPIVGSQVAT